MRPLSRFIVGDDEQVIMCGFIVFDDVASLVMPYPPSRFGSMVGFKAVNGLRPFLIFAVVESVLGMLNFLRKTQIEIC